MTDGLALLQHFGQRRPYRRTAPQRQQQVRLRLRPELGEHRFGLVPQGRRVHDEARFGGAAQLQHQPERRFHCHHDFGGWWRQDGLDPQAQTRPSGQAVSGVGEPLREIADVGWLGRGERG